MVLPSQAPDYRSFCDAGKSLCGLYTAGRRRTGGSFVQDYRDLRDMRGAILDPFSALSFASVKSQESNVRN